MRKQLVTTASNIIFILERQCYKHVKDISDPTTRLARLGVS